jgi:hypothetical protein
VVSGVVGGPVVEVVGGSVVGVVGGWVVGVALVGVKETCPPPPNPRRRVVVVTAASRGLVLVSLPLETPRNVPVPGEPSGATVDPGARLGPVLGGIRESLGEAVDAGENSVPRASQSGPHRPWAARAKAIENATRARTEKPAARTGRCVCQPWASAANACAIRPPNAR